MITPAGFENMFREFCDITDTRGVPEIVGLSEKYGLPFAQPDWLTDVIARYNLTPPPGM